MVDNTDLVIKCIQELIGNCPVSGAEVGCYIGGTTNKLLRAFPKAKIYAIDPWEKGDAQNTTLRRRSKESAKLVRETFYSNVEWAGKRLTILFMKSIEGALLVDDGSLDFVFIDGDHRYVAIHEDLPAWWRKLRSGGVCIVHDYRRDGPGRFGVIQAVDEFCAEQNLVPKMLDPIMVALQKP